VFGVNTNIESHLPAQCTYCRHCAIVKDGTKYCNPCNLMGQCKEILDPTFFLSNIPFWAPASCVSMRPQKLPFLCGEHPHEFMFSRKSLCSMFTDVFVFLLGIAFDRKGSLQKIWGVRGLKKVSGL
jgi:hypothetical protein